MAAAIQITTYVCGCKTFSTLKDYGDYTDFDYGHENLCDQHESIEELHEEIRYDPYHGMGMYDYF